MAACLHEVPRHIKEILVARDKFLKSKNLEVNMAVEEKVKSIIAEQLGERQKKLLRPLPS